MRGTFLDLALLVAAAVAFAVLSLREPPHRGVEIEIRDPPPGVDDIRVHVTGAVRTPGVVTVAPGARVSDALWSAGGPAASADLDAVNLARRVRDEEQLRIPLIGQRAALIDLNRADGATLESLPGIGPGYAARILEARAGEPFASSDELVERRLIPRRVYEAIRDLVRTP